MSGIGATIKGLGETAGDIGGGIGLVSTLVSLVSSFFEETNVTNATEQLRLVYEAQGRADFGAELVRVAGASDAGERIQELLTKTGGKVIGAANVVRGFPGASPEHCMGFNLWVAVINGLLRRTLGVSGFKGCTNDEFQTPIAIRLADAGLSFDVFRQVESELSARRPVALTTIASVEAAIGFAVIDRDMLRSVLGLKPLQAAGAAPVADNPLSGPSAPAPQASAPQGGAQGASAATGGTSLSPAVLLLGGLLLLGGR